MTTSPPDTTALLQLAGSVFAEGETAATITERIVLYSEAFDRWYSAAEPLLAAGESAPLGGIEKLRELELQHARVMARAQELMTQTEVEAKGLKLKGKGMVAYTDILPKQISTKKLPRG